MKIKKLGWTTLLLAAFTSLGLARETDGTNEYGTIYDPSLRYEINPDGVTLYVSGPNNWPDTGWIGDFEIPEAVNVGSVRMPVTAIGEQAFAYGNISGRLTIPSSILSIGESAFWGNIVSDVVHQGSITFIGENAFRECPNLSSFRIPAAMRVIQPWTFYGCPALQTVEFHNGITTIRNTAFGSCHALQNVKLPADLVTIESEAFIDCISLSGLVFPSKIKVVGDEAFRYCNSLESVVFPSSVTSIGTRSFDSCLNLKTVTFLGELPDLGFYSESISNGDNTSLVTIICKPGIGFEQAFDDKSEYRILYSTPYAALQDQGGKLIKNGAKISFGMVDAESKGQTVKLRVKNLGSKALKLKKPKFTGAQNKSFTMGSKIPSSIAPGKSATFIIRFKPLIVGSLKSTFELKSNDPTKKILKLRLSGKGE
jgi:hypothetical protein